MPAELPSDVKKLPKAEALTKGDQFSVKRLFVVARRTADRLQRKPRP